MKTALYYPYIHFRSRHWLRTAALYYDQITRIIPAGSEPDTVLGYSELLEDPRALLDDVRALRDADIIVEEHPEPHTEAVAEQFFDFASTLLLDPLQRMLIAPQLARRKAFYTIHPGKIDPTLARLLQEHDVARRIGDANSDWALDPVIGGLYMLFLARHMAGKRPLVSDNSVYQSLLYASFSVARPRGAPLQTPCADNAFKLATAVVRTVIPIDLEDAPIDKVLKVREQYAQHRYRFQEKVSELAKSLDAATSTAASNKVTQQLESISDEVENIRDKLLSQDIGLGSAILSLAVPVTAALEGNFSMALLSGAVAVATGVARYFVERRVVERSPWTYLVKANSYLAPKQFADRIIRLNLEFDSDDDADDPRTVFGYA